MKSRHSLIESITAAQRAQARDRLDSIGSLPPDAPMSLAREGAARTRRGRHVLSQGLHPAGAAVP